MEPSLPALPGPGQRLPAQTTDSDPVSPPSEDASTRRNAPQLATREPPRPLLEQPDSPALRIGNGHGGFDWDDAHDDDRSREEILQQEILDAVGDDEAAPGLSVDVRRERRNSTSDKVRSFLRRARSFTSSPVIASTSSAVPSPTLTSSSFQPSTPATVDTPTMLSVALDGKERDTSLAPANAALEPPVPCWATKRAPSPIPSIAEQHKKPGLFSRKGNFSFSRRRSSEREEEKGGTVTDPPAPIALPSLPSLDLSHRLSWAYGSIPPGSPPRTLNLPADSPPRRRTPARAWTADPQRPPVGLGFDVPLAQPGRARRLSVTRAAVTTRFSRSNSASSLVAPERTTGPPSVSSATTVQHPWLPRPGTLSAMGRRPATPGSAPSSLFGSVTGFFANSSMSRSRSSSSSSLAPPPPFVESYGALFEGKGRKRGLSSGSFGGNFGAGSKSGSTTSLTGVKDALLAPIAMVSLGTVTSASTPRSRSSTDPRRFSSSSNASTQSSFVPSTSSPLLPFPLSKLGVMEAEMKQKRKRLLEVQEGESARTYVSRLLTTVNPAEVAGILATSTDAFNCEALSIFFETFDLKGPLDIALRTVLLSTSLPAETQQIDRVLEAFAGAYHSSNPGLFRDALTPYVLAFSLILLSTDLFSRSNRAPKMSAAQYISNTTSGAASVGREILEYLYDQMKVAPFVFAHVDSEQPEMPQLGQSNSSSFFSREVVNPYPIIAAGLTHQLRVDVESTIPLKTPFSASGTTPFVNTTALHHAFAQAPTLQISPSRTAPSPSTDGAPLGPTTSVLEGEAMACLRITKVGLLSRKEDVLDGKKASSRKWKTYSVVLTGSQLFFFKDASWATTFQKAIDDSPSDGTLENRRVTLPLTSTFKPDAVLSLANAIALHDSSYRREHVFRLVLARRQYLFHTYNAADLNSWIAHVNFAATYKTAGIKMRPLRSSANALLEQLPGRTDALRSKIASLDVEIAEVLRELEGDLQLAKHLAVLTPFLRTTRDRLISVVPPIGKRVRQARMHLVKILWFREVLTKDLLTPRAARMGSIGGSEDSFSSAKEERAASDDELAGLRAPSMAKRTLTSTSSHGFSLRDEETELDTEGE